MGYEICQDINSANVILFNTCAIREHAEMRVFGNIGDIKRLKIKNPDLIIILCGCMTQQENSVKKIQTCYPFVDLIFGTDFYDVLPKILYEKLSGNIKKFLELKTNFNINEEIKVLRDSPVHANVPIMFGCENFCSYCIVPFVKGPERSRDLKIILNEIENLIKCGYKKITLLGQNVNSYGKKIGSSFAELLTKIDEISGNFWVDFMSSHPKDLTNQVIDVIAQSNHICNHIHLPLQSGSNRILSLMNRKYTSEKYLEIVDYAKSKIVDLSLTSDIIVGFPGETFDDFEKTVSIVEQVKFSGLFTFIYSKRNGTAAAKMPDLTAKSEKTKRLMHLIEIQKIISENIHKKYLGKILDALVYKDFSGKIISKTKNNFNVEITNLKSYENLNGKIDFFGKFVKINVTGFKNSTLIGEIL